MKRRPSSAPLARAPFAAACAASLLVAACSSSASSPSNGDVVVNFPSIAAAVATSTITITVFDAKTQATCQELVEAARSRASLPAPMIATDPIGPCSAPGKVDVGYGRRAFLVTGERGGQSFLVGCAVAEVFEGSDPAAVSLTLFDDTQSVPATKCTKLSDFCGKKC